ncbi:hypothetical protein FOL47_006988 [Perkinsus chesapeaki]|uniref:HP domain-containing protein n=1 Tax=Perkinsus chesapeaki TaxID=330153 RepID=A0A7J6N2R4_PERCH|nr:hypothetical protein FOL47_006988 [Perkinsus chesapeaki]
MGKSKSNKKKQQKEDTADDEVIVDEVKGDDSPLDDEGYNTKADDRNKDTTNESIVVEDKGDDKGENTVDMEGESNNTLPVDDAKQGDIEAVDTAMPSTINVDDAKQGDIEVVDTAMPSTTDVDDAKQGDIEAVDTAMPSTTDVDDAKQGDIEVVDTAIPSTTGKGEEDVTSSSLNDDNTTLTTPKTKVNPYSPSPVSSTLISPINGEMATTTNAAAGYVQTPSTADVDNTTTVDDQTKFKWKVQNTGYLQSSLRASLSSDYAPIRSSTGITVDATPVTDNRTFEDPSKVKYPLEQLLGLAENLPAGVNPSKREAYLSPEEFCSVFGMDMNKFYSMPLWKQRTTKKTVGLF